jgi:hypothetical protein
MALLRRARAPFRCGAYPRAAIRPPKGGEIANGRRRRGTRRVGSVSGGPARFRPLGRHELVSSTFAGRLQRMIKARIGVCDRPEPPESQHIAQFPKAPHVPGTIKRTAVLIDELLMPLRRQGKEDLTGIVRQAPCRPSSHVSKLAGVHRAARSTPMMAPSSHSANTTDAMPPLQKPYPKHRQPNTGRAVRRAPSSIRPRMVASDTPGASTPTDAHKPTVTTSNTTEAAPPTPAR